MRVTPICVLCGLLVVLAGGLAEAQPPGRGPGGGPGMMGPGMMGQGMMGRGMDAARLLMIEQVQKEINLTGEQKDKLEALREEMREQFRGGEDRGRMREEMQNLSEEERRERMQKMMQEFREQAEKRAKETMTKLAEVLTPEQMLRIKQIQMQQEGVMVLRRPEVIEELGLDDSQKEQLEKIAEEVGTQMRERMESFRGRGGDREEGDRDREGMRERMQQMREEMEKVRKDVEQKAMGVLTADQKKKLGEMMGKPFELDRSAMGRPEGGPRGGEDRRGEARRGEGRRGEGQRGEGRRGEGRRGERPQREDR